MELMETLHADMLAMGIAHAGFWGGFLAFFTRLDYPAVLLFRLSVWMRGYGVAGKVLSFLFWRLNAFLNGCDIRPDAQIGPGLSLPHPVGVVIGPIKAGSRLTVHQNVTMGRSRSQDEFEGADSRATLGDDVMIYAGAVLLGGLKIGDGATIGANAVVLSDVPAGQTAFAMPARCLAAKPVIQ